MSATIAPHRVFTAILMRDIRVAARELPFFLLRTALQPLLFVTIFGFVMPKMGIVGAGYSALMLPGILALSLTLSAIQSVSLPLAIDFGATKEIEDRLLAPAPIRLVAIEKIVAGVLQGIIAAAFVLPIARLIMGPIPGLSFAHIPLLIAITIFGGIAFSTIGLFLGTAIPPQQIGMMFSVVVAPMIMFGCTYYPWMGLKRIPVMQILVLADPLVYVAEGMRAALTPNVPHMPLWMIFLVPGVMTAAFLWRGLQAFNRRAVS
jgi:ABC-2 type transport system permease protein